MGFRITAQTLVGLNFPFMTVGHGTPTPVAAPGAITTSACSPTDPRHPLSCIPPPRLLTHKGFFGFYLQTVARNPNIGYRRSAGCSLYLMSGCFLLPPPPPRPSSNLALETSVFLSTNRVSKG